MTSYPTRRYDGRTTKKWSIAEKIKLTYPRILTRSNECKDWCGQCQMQIIVTIRTGRARRGAAVPLKRAWCSRGPIWKLRSMLARLEEEVVVHRTFLMLRAIRFRWTQSKLHWCLMAILKAQTSTKWGSDLQQHSTFGCVTTAMVLAAFNGSTFAWKTLVILF